MNNQKLIILAGATMTSAMAFAESVNVETAGMLSSQITDFGVTTLNVSGKIDARDLFFISENLTSLANLDLSKSTIERYSGDELRGHSEYAANEIPDYTFASAALTSVAFPTIGELSIGEMAFAATKLTAIELPENVEKVGAYAFSDCSQVTTLKMGSNITISDGAFARCSSLETVDGEENLRAIAAYSFMGCKSLKEFDFGTGLQVIGEGAFDSAGLEDVNLVGSENLVSVKARAFSNNTSLLKVQFDHNKSVEIGEGAFIGCSSLEWITLPCVDEISDYAFAETTTLTGLILPPSVKYIGTNAMTNMTGLQVIEANAVSEVPALGTDVWHGVDQDNVKVYALESMISDFESAEQWKEFIYEINTNVVDNIVATATDVKGRFEGAVLHVISNGEGMASVALYDASGVNLKTVAVGGNEVSISTSDYSTQIYIVKATLTNGNIATVKLIRK